MSAQGVTLAMNKIAGDLLALSHAILEDDSISTNTKVGRNTLRKSALNDELAVRISQTTGDDPVINALFNNYVVYLEWDRPKKHGKRPPIDVLVDWARKNGIPTDADTLWKISTAIWRDGHVGRPIFATIDANLDQLFTVDWSDDLLAAITDNLDKFFND